MASNEEILRRATNLSKSLSGIDKRLDKIIKEIAITQETSNIYWSKINRQIRNEYEKARKISAAWTNSNLPAIYKEDLNSQLQKIKAKSIPGIRKIDFKTAANTDMAKQSIRSLVTETTATYTIGYNSGERTLLRLSSLTQQLNVNEKQIEKNIADGFLEKGTAQGSSKAIQKELLKKSLDGKYITIINKNGNKEQWKIKAYSDLVARTKLRETSTQAVINSAQAVGGDLVQVSSHNTLTPFDAQFEGKIYSLSGNDKDFPAAGPLPPFHPNCLHSITVVFGEALKVSGVLDKSIDFSNNITQEHPTRRSHIPVGKRKF